MGLKVRNGKGLCHGGQQGREKLYNTVCLCGSAHNSGCVVVGLSVLSIIELVNQISLLE